MAFPYVSITQTAGERYPTQVEISEEERIRKHLLEWALKPERSLKLCPLHD